MHIITHIKARATIGSRCTADKKRDIAARVLAHLLIPVVAGAYVALHRKTSPLLVILACGAIGSVLAALGAWT